MMSVSSNANAHKLAPYALTLFTRLIPTGGGRSRRGRGGVMVLVPESYQHVIESNEIFNEP